MGEDVEEETREVARGDLEAYTLLLAVGVSKSRHKIPKRKEKKEKGNTEK